MDKGFRITYQTTTPESVEHGECEDQGWINEEGVSMIRDTEDGLTATDNAISFLETNTGANGLEYSSSGNAYLDGWWISMKYSEDFATGEIEDRGFHPYGFSKEELQEIIDGVTASRIND